MQGAVRRTSSLEPSRLAHLYADPVIYHKKFFLHCADLDDPATLRRVLTRVAPRELYHLAGQSQLSLSFEIPETTCEFTAMGTLRLLEIIRDLTQPPRFFHATSSEIFGRPREVPQTESTPIAPVNPYGCAKAFATQMVKIYRESHGLFAVNGIMNNHESRRRGENFVTSKICRAAAAIKLGHQRHLTLGDTSPQRDWDHARDYVHGMWLALHHDILDDCLFASASSKASRTSWNIPSSSFTWIGRPMEPDPQLLSPAEPLHLVGDVTKARIPLDWVQKITLTELIPEMILAEFHAQSR